MQHVRDWTGADALSSSSDLVSGLIRQSRKPLVYPTRDAFQTIDQATIDSAGAFLIGELERLDPKLHQPLVSITWQRDIDVRSDVQLGDDTSSFTVSTFAMGGTPNFGTGISWSSSLATTLARPTLDISKIVSPLDTWAGEVQYSIPDLEKSKRIGRPIDEQQLNALRMKYQMDLDQAAYIGDSFKGTTGLVNNSLVTPSNVANGAGGSMLWASKSYDEIMTDVNSLLISTWAAAGYAVAPNKLLLPPSEFGRLSTKLIGTSGFESVLGWIKRNNVLTAQTGEELEILPVKWLEKANLNGPGGNAASYARMVAYRQQEDYVRFPMVPIQAIQPQPQGIYIKMPYWSKIGVVEVVYPETCGYRDGIA